MLFCSGLFLFFPNVFNLVFLWSPFSQARVWARFSLIAVLIQIVVFALIVYDHLYDSHD